MTLTPVHLGERTVELEVVPACEAYGIGLIPWSPLGGGLLGESPADVALTWLLHQSAVTAPIIGPRTPEQLAGARRAPELSLDEATLARLDEIFPGPGGPAPEAYAW